MLVRNTTLGDALVADKVEAAQTWGARLKGLLGRKSIAPGEGLLITPCNSIHMFFMRFAIDVAFLAHDGRVVKVVHSIKPWRATRVYFDAHSALELPPGTLAQTGVQEGDVLAFVDENSSRDSSRQSTVEGRQSKVEGER